MSLRTLRIAMVITPQLAPGEGLMKLCPMCGGTILSPSISGATRGTCHCPHNRTTTTEEAMTSKKQKRAAKASKQEPQEQRDHGTAENPQPVTYTLPEPKAPEKVAEPKAPKVPKPIAFDAQGEVKAAKQGSKLAALIDALATGATMEQLVKVLSQSGSAVDASGVRSWIAYDLKRTGLGVYEDGNLFRLIGTPLPHRDATPKK